MTYTSRQFLLTDSSGNILSPPASAPVERHLSRLIVEKIRDKETLHRLAVISVERNLEGVITGYEIEPYKGETPFTIYHDSLLQISPSEDNAAGNDGCFRSA